MKENKIKKWFIEHKEDIRAAGMYAVGFTLGAVVGQLVGKAVTVENVGDGIRQMCEANPNLKSEMIKAGKEVWGIDIFKV